jgi:hypothetical protein
MWLYCCPWYFSPWIAYLSSCSPQCDRSAETIVDRQGNGGDHEGGRSGSLRGCCRRLASSPSASAPASAAAAVVRGKLGALGFRLGVRFRGFSPSPAPRGPNLFIIRRNLLMARAARPGGRPAVGTRQCGRGGIGSSQVWAARPGIWPNLWYSTEG